MLIEITYNVTDVYMSTTETPVYVEISFEQPGSASAVWGSITGTLSNQTDLQNALNLKVPYTGATTNVNLGEYELKAGQVTLDTSPTGTAAVGTIRWNDTTGTSETTLKGGNVIIKNGVDLVARVVNKVTPNTTLTKAAYQAVRVSGAQGQRLAIALAQANNDANSADTIGLVTETIATNQEGFIMTVGQLEGINTTGSLQGETWVDGDVLYLSPTTAGAITNVKPTAVTGHIVVIGYVEYAHVNNGKIYVKVMNGWELDELHNVSIVTPTDNQGLFYNSTSTLWENKSITTALGYTPVPTTRNITINGVTYDLSADRTWTIAAGISGSGASGQVTYWTGASSVSGSNNLFWDNTNGRLGIGTNAPNAEIQITKASAAAGAVGQRVYNTTSSGETYNAIYNDLNEFGALGIFGSTWANATQRRTASFTSSALNGFNIAIFNSSATANFSILTSTTLTERLRLYNNTGNLVLQNGGTFTDNGQRLQVYGDTLLRGSGSTIATTALTVQNSSSTNLLRVLNDGDVSFGADAFYWDAVTSRLGIGTNAPAQALEIYAPIGRAAVRSTNNNQNSAFLLYAKGATGVEGSGGLYYVGNDAPTNRYFAITGDNTNYHLAVTYGGQTLIGATTNNGQRLQVYGDTLLRGSGATSATTALTVQNSSSTNLLTVRNDGVATFGGDISINASSSSPSIQVQSNTSSTVFDGNAQGSGTVAFELRNSGVRRFRILGTATNTTFESSNQTGSFIFNNRITLPASSTTKSSLNIASGTAPTTPNDGDIWFDGTNIQMRIGGVTKTFTLI